MPLQTLPTRASGAAAATRKVAPSAAMHYHPIFRRPEGGPIPTTFTKIVSTLDGSFGKCLKCMRQSLLGAAVGWLVFGGARLLWPANPSVDVVILLPLGLTALWLLHLGAYVVRRTFIARRAMADPAPGDQRQPGGGRKMLQELVSAAGIAVRASFGGSLPDVDESEVIAAYRNALRIQDQIKRKRGRK